MQNTKQTKTRPQRRTAGARAALGLSVLVAAGLLGGCGIGGAGADSSAALLSGMPKCDPSLLHPHIAVGAAAGLPGKSIVFVDGVMACVDDSSHVDQLLTQLEGRGLGAALTLPAAGTTPAGGSTTPNAGLTAPR